MAGVPGGNVKDAKAGQGVSYVLGYNAHRVRNTSTSTADGAEHRLRRDRHRRRHRPPRRQHGGRDLEGQGWAYSDSTGWDYTGWEAYGFNSPVQVSAGRQGVIGFVDSFGHAWDWSQATGQVGELDSGATKITFGYDQNGGMVIDELFSNGNVMDWRAANGWRFFDYNVRSIAKARAGIVDDVSNANNAWEFDPWVNDSLLASGVQMVA